MSGETFTGIRKLLRGGVVACRWSLTENVVLMFRDDRVIKQGFTFYE
ncbi:hypothetical protein [Sphaerisporangium sp. TRM90804]|nr:hypothetical protein [Sphaerisporangium sp. TRM90804]MDH2430322.1 hypothetical protein [Sphaerisporangium sp. TRM90804]